MVLDFESWPDVWTYTVAFPRAPARTVSALQRLAERVASAVAERAERDPTLTNESPTFVFGEMSALLHGARLERVYRRRDAFGPPVHPNTVDANVPKLEEAYGLTKLRVHRASLRARTVILLAAESRLAPLIEGNLAALDAGPTSTRIDLRGAFHLVSRWWWQNEPRLLSRLAIFALQPDHEDGGAEPIPFRPITRLYQGVLDHHRPADFRETEAEQLSVATTRILYDAAKRRSLKREILQQLFAEAEGLRILDRRPSFDVEPARRRRNELTRVVLARELGTALEPQAVDLVALLESADSPRPRTRRTR